MTKRSNRRVSGPAPPRRPFISTEPSSTSCRLAGPGPLADLAGPAQKRAQTAHPAHTRSEQAEHEKAQAEQDQPAPQDLDRRADQREGTRPFTGDERPQGADPAGKAFHQPHAEPGEDQDDHEPEEEDAEDRVEAERGR